MRADPVVTALAAVTAIAVIDGDTVHRGAERYRLLGLDAAEIHHAQCDAERRLGELTKKRLQDLMGSSRVELKTGQPAKRDKYGRLLVKLLVNGEDAACILIMEGYARPRSGRRENLCINAPPPDDADTSDCAVPASRH
jgi:endonuclease YncB( thermonuclease family)